MPSPILPTSSSPSTIPTATTFSTPSEQSGSNLLWYYIIASIVAVVGVVVAILTFYFKQIIIVRSKKRTERYTDLINKIENKLKSGNTNKGLSSEKLVDLKEEILKDPEIVPDDCDRLVKVIEEILKK
jgi:hypothetical protein